MTPERARLIAEQAFLRRTFGFHPDETEERIVMAILTACFEDTETLRAENARLREALRFHVIVDDAYCSHCMVEWNSSNERHAPGCLASKGEDK